MPSNLVLLISTGISLVAFIIAVATWRYRGQLNRSEQLIKNVTEEDRKVLVKQTLEKFGVNTENLSAKEQTKIALTQIKARARRFLISSLVAVTVAILATITMVSALPNTQTPSTTGFAGNLSAPTGIKIHFNRVQGDGVYLLGQQDNSFLEQLGQPTVLVSYLSNTLFKRTSQEYISSNSQDIHEVSFILVQNTSERQFSRVEIKDVDYSLIAGITDISPNESVIVITKIEVKPDSGIIAQVLLPKYMDITNSLEESKRRIVISVPQDDVEWRQVTSDLYRAYPIDAETQPTIGGGE